MKRCVVWARAATCSSLISVLEIWTRCFRALGMLHSPALLFPSPQRPFSPVETAEWRKPSTLFARLSFFPHFPRGICVTIHPIAML